MHKRWTRMTAIAAPLALMVLGMPSAGAGTAAVSDVQAVSAGPLPCGAPVDLEVDTRIAVNPTNPQNIAVSWYEATALVTVVAVSHDGGKNWTQHAVPGHSGCTLGEPGSFSYDPAVVFDRDGDLYVGSLVDGLRHERVLVSRSTDGGETWQGPELVDEYEVPVDNDVWLPSDSPDLGQPQFRNHELWLAADPHVGGRIYAAWKKHDIRPTPKGNRYWPAYFSERRRLPESGDGAGAWSPAQDFYRPAQLVLPFGHTLRVLGNGTVLDVFWECDARPPIREGEDGSKLCDYSHRGRVLALQGKRSSNGGWTWTATPFVVAEPACGLDEQRRPKPSLDVAADGTVYATWHAMRCGNDGRSRILLSRSTDGGERWSAPLTIVKSDVNLFQPTLAVGAAGMIGVTYYEWDEELDTTDVWLVHSHDRGATWDEKKKAHIGGPFGPVLSDYYGLAALPDGFAASFVQASPAAPEPPQDVFFARVYIPTARGGG